MVLKECVFGDTCLPREAKEGFLEAVAFELRSEG